jgi:hypothetical protein
MSETSGKEILTFWLIPADPARRYFQSLIRDFAERFDAPVFEPHVTLYVTDAVGEDAAGLLKRAVVGTEPCQLAIAGVGHSRKFTKTLFIQFVPNDGIAALSAKFASASKLRRDYQIDPHLSLIYKELPAAEKALVAANLAIPFRDVFFDSVKAILSPAEIKSCSAVEAWRVIGEARLK